MTVRHEIKSQLAKLLATEDLVVEHKKCDTAQFNVHTRVLTLPLWEKASGTVYDLLVGHEVGHALYTPDEDWTEKVKVPLQFVNIVEDARIEKMMKRRYPGLAKTFFGGYKEFSEQDFFQIGDDDVNTYNLADRANLYFKVGNFVSISFKEDEKKIIDLISNAETFSDALLAAKELYDFCKQDQERELNKDDIPNNNSSPGDGGDKGDQENQEFPDASEHDDSNTSPSTTGGDSEGPKQEKSKSSNPGDHYEEPQVKTEETLRDKILDFVNHSGRDNLYVELPQVNLDTAIIPNSEIYKYSYEYMDVQIERTEDSTLYTDVDAKFLKFKNDTQKEVNYLVKEFECRKSADAYSRAMVSKTGTLDCTKLHSYKYNEDLFRKVSIIPDGKNHGLIFILDWSGSMSEVLIDTIKQLYNLIWFCKKVQIPFEVYAFTNEWSHVHYDQNGKAVIPKKHYDPKEGLVAINESFSLLNIFTHKTNSKELEKQMKNIWRIANAFQNSYHVRYSYPSRLSLSGTPLNESLITLHQILPKFQKDNKLQKVQCVVLTDGEASALPYHVNVKRQWDAEPYLGLRHINFDSTFLRDRKTGQTYSIEGSYTGFTDILLRNLRDNFPSVNFIGIRILPSREFNSFIRNYCEIHTNEYASMQNDWKKNRSVAIRSSGYHAYFGLSSSSLSNNSDFEVSEDATKVQIKNAFVKSLKTKKLNKKILGEFVQLIA
jgi:hypothetical protein